MEALDSKRDDWFDYIISIMKVLGMHPLDFAFLPQPLRFIRHILNFFFYAFWHFIILHLAYVQNVSVYLNFDQTLDEIISYVMNASIYVYLYFIICFMELNCSKILKLLNFMQRNFRERSAKGLTFVSIEESVMLARKYCMVWIYCCLFGTLSWLVYPLFKCCKILPLKSWYPIDVSYFPTYQLAYLFQAFGQVHVGVGYGICGGLNIVMISMICGQYDILYASLKNLEKAVSSKDSEKLHEFRNKQKNFDPEKEELNQYLLSTEKFDDPVEDEEVPSLTECLKDCVEHHQMILDFVKLVEDLFNIFVLTKTLYAAMLVCVIAYVFSTLEEFSPIKVGNLLMYLGLSSSELLLFNLSAELLRQHSARAGDALMRADWDEFDLKTQKSMIIILANAAKPATLTGGKILILSVDQFRAAMGTAFSYYTLLKKMKEKSQSI